MISDSYFWRLDFIHWTFHGAQEMCKTCWILPLGTLIEGDYCARSWIWLTWVLFFVWIAFICHKKNPQKNHFWLSIRFLLQGAAWLGMHAFLYVLNDIIFKLRSICVPGTYVDPWLLLKVPCLSLLLVPLLKILIFLLNSHCRVLFRRAVKWIWP